MRGHQLLEALDRLCAERAKVLTRDLRVRILCLLKISLRLKQTAECEPRLRHTMDLVGSS